MSLKSKNKLTDKQTYVFTDNNGKEIQFMVEEYTKDAVKVSDSK